MNLMKKQMSLAANMVFVAWFLMSILSDSSMQAFAFSFSPDVVSTQSSSSFRRSTIASRLSMSTSASTTSSTSTLTNDKGLLKRDRYIATNRFAVRQGKSAKFEQRWATRKSRLAELDGFQYFHLMRRVTLKEEEENRTENEDEDATTRTPTVTTKYDEGTDEESAQGNMVSFTVWKKKSDFSAWRSGEAFKEAHGGTSIGAFLSTMVNSAFVLRGPPRPAFYDGLLLQSTPPEHIPATVDGWRQVDADGVHPLPTECFVACNQFFVPPEHQVAFEQRWANRSSQLQNCDGFIAFSMLRRDGQAKGHGTVEMDTMTEPTYMSTTIWKDVSSFQAWKTGSAFRQAHSTTSTTSTAAAAAAAANKGQESKKEGGGDDDDSNSSNNGKDNQGQPQPLWTKPPQPIFYEGVLVITNENGV